MTAAPPIVMPAGLLAGTLFGLTGAVGPAMLVRGGPLA